MMKSEFIERVGFEPTAAEYEEIEAEYMGTDIDKDQFCKEWKKNGGVQRLMRLRARRIEELEHKLVLAENQYDEMESSYCRRINKMKTDIDGKLNEACTANDQLREKNAELAQKLQEEQDARKKAEHKLNTVRAAFAILGIGKEEA